MTLSPTQVAQNVDVRAIPPASISQGEAFSTFLIGVGFSYRQFVYLHHMNFVIQKLLKTCAQISAFKTILPQLMTTRGLWLLIHGECCKIRGNGVVHLFLGVSVFLFSREHLIWVHLTTLCYNTIVSVGKHNYDCKINMETI